MIPPLLAEGGRGCQVPSGCRANSPTIIDVASHENAGRVFSAEATEIAELVKPIAF
jgi:hypothetical protein